MRPVLGSVLLAAALGASLSAQTMTEAAVAAAGGTVGGMAGKKVSDGVSTIFGKVNQQTANAAGTPEPSKGKATTTTSKSALIEAGPGRPDDGPSSVVPAAPKATATKPKAKPKTVAAASTSSRDGDIVVVPPSAWDDVPPPPPLERRATPAPIVRPAPKAVGHPVIALAPPPPPPPPPPVMTADDFSKVEPGMTRADVLKFGQPSSRITMFENGGLLEIFSYQTHDAVYGDTSLGEIRLMDGAVSGIVRRN